MEKRWHILEAPENKVKHLFNALTIHPALCKILIQRGIETYDQAKDYFRPQLSDLHNPMLMKDMNKAVGRIVTAFEKKEKILVFGDYDVDGTTAVSCMFRFLQKIYISENVEFYIPHRYREGYGVSREGIDYALENNITLIIALDCGIKSVELVRYAGLVGVDFIICDHHLPDEELPPAAAILNPKQKDCPYPYKELCGCGVGFKLICALSRHLGLNENECFNYLDLVATAIAADIVPMTGENRILAYYGVKQVNENPSPGIKALIELSGLQKSTIHITNLVFVIAPRINAAGRMDDARKAVQLFIEEDYAKAIVYAGMLHSDNDERKEADSSITEQALSIIESDETLVQRQTTVVYQPHWHKGVVGIVASRLIEKYYRPTVVLTQSGEIVAGSARSVPGFNLYEAVHACRQHLLGYGGHFAAAGMTMRPEHVEAFSNKFEEVVKAQIKPAQRIPVLFIDAEIELADIKPVLYKIICQMEPFGPENLRPVFVCRKITDTGYSRIVKEQHIKFSIKQNNTVMNGIGFNMVQHFGILQSQKPVDIVFTIDENEWNGEKSLQLKVIDLRLSSN
ncbi:single-stranded-DNA-specific exonuclease RecJ [Agriterribacter sp.]|uniref:single-stranded-DNA-specific exonuclease RecJ n=1 Tax=Agriterribacter sp. TaxID=2821509 RepID=UPI002C06CBFB|nr:single-stranded-DNA-specific exonuclease RecJ [Agriterribacter sp.]HRP54726.1 single-stranded-DNA-specific exonuclease RecJ [Agriterribacter sp.]